MTKLKINPNFSLSFSPRGGAFLEKRTEPYDQFWINEPERALWNTFSAKKGRSPSSAIRSLLRNTAKTKVSEAKKLTKRIRDLVKAGALVDVSADTSRYDGSMAESYAEFRRFPSQIAQWLIEASGVDRKTKVIDLAGGPGDLSLAFARLSDEVALMDLSQSFLKIAGRRAEAQQLKLRLIHDSCNQLGANGETYDVITISQALHWMDDTRLLQGVSESLSANGHFFVIHSSVIVDQLHPLAFVLSTPSSGDLVFSEEASLLASRTSALLWGLSCPRIGRSHVDERKGRVLLRDVQFFRQRRVFDYGYARALLTPQHVALRSGEPEQFWRDIATDFSHLEEEQLKGVHEWCVLHFVQSQNLDEPMASLDNSRFDCTPTPIGDDVDAT